MGTRILTFHHKEPVGNETRIGPTYYMEADYTPVAVRIHAESAPTTDAEVDIFDDGTSIFSNRKSTLIDGTTGAITIVSDATTVILATGEYQEENAENFSSQLIEAGSWVHCTLKAGGGKNFTVQFEMHSSDEALTEET